MLASLTSGRALPLLDYLCEMRACSIPELQVLLANLDERRRIVAHMRYDLELATMHLRPTERNFVVRAHDLSAQSAQTLPAMGGYLAVTVRQYYYVRHGVRLRHPYLPCVIMHVGGGGRCYYPMEVLQVRVCHTAAAADAFVNRDRSLRRQRVRSASSATNACATNINAWSCGGTTDWGDATTSVNDDRN